MMKIKTINKKPEKVTLQFEQLSVGDTFRTYDNKYNLKTSNTAKNNALLWNDEDFYWSEYSCHMNKIVKPMESEIVFNEGTL